MAKSRSEGAPVTWTTRPSSSVTMPSPRGVGGGEARRDERAHQRRFGLRPFERRTDAPHDAVVAVDEALLLR